MQLSLKNKTINGSAVAASFASAGFGFIIPANAGPAAQASFRHTGTAGFWYVMFNRTVGPTTTNYSKKIGPGEPWTEDNPPTGQVWFLADGSVNGNLDWYAGWHQ